MTYNLKTGLWKSFKNTAVVLVIPALYFLVNNWQEWVPTQYNTYALPIFGFIGYFLKNYKENK